jgi:TatD DNase family protein
VSNYLGIIELLCYNPVMPLPTLDAHAHLDPQRTSAELAEAGPLLAMTLSVGEADKVRWRDEPLVAFSVGCHPRRLAAQQAFDPARFSELASHTAVIGEIGLDTASRVPLELQLGNFRTALAYAARNPRLVSIHSHRSTSLVLDELARIPILAPILHWWTGSANETQRAVELGCYFSVHSAVARRSLFRTRVPPERLLVESDHGWADPPGAIPHRIAWVEYLLSASLGIKVIDIRRLVWRNFSDLVHLCGVQALLTTSLSNLLP